MNPSTEMDEFRRMELVAQVERPNGLIAAYQRHIAFYRERLDRFHHLLGRIGQRLNEPEPEEPQWR
jgi:hypothetical protein